MRLVKTVRFHRWKVTGFVLAGLIFIVGGVFVLPEFISADGALIWTQTRDFGGNEEDVATAVAVDATGLYVVGYDSAPGSYTQWRMEKRNLADGSVIWTQTYANVNYEITAKGVAVDSSGVYVVGYNIGSGYAAKWRIEKRNLTDGSLIWAQTNNDVIPYGKIAVATGAAVDSSGIYVVGWDNSPGNYQWRVEKRDLTTGSVIWTKTGNPSSSYDGALGVAVDSSGIYIVGYDNVGSPGSARWRMEKRNLTDGGLLWMKRKSDSYSIAAGVAVDSSGVYAVGWDDELGTGNTQLRIEKRNLADGSSIWSQTNNLSSAYEEANGVAVDAGGIYVVGYRNGHPYSGNWHLEKRGLADGSLIWAQSDTSISDTEATGVAVDSSGVYAVGYDSGGSGSFKSQWRMEKRRTSAPPTPPAVTTQSASSVGDSGAVLNGLANPNNGSTTGWFRYDTTSPGSCNDTFGTRLPLSGGTSLGSGSTNVSFAQTVGGLNSTTTYYFCAIAENSAGKSYGSVLSFATAASGAVSSYGVTREGCQLKNWGWGDEVVGWVSFNSTNNYGGKTPGANYGATLTNFCQNVAPNAPSGLSVTDTSSANWSFNCVSPLQPTFSWMFSDPNTDDSQYAYQVQVDNNLDFSSPEYDSGSVTSTALTTSVPAGRLSYNTTYNWRVKTWDNRKTPLVSPWTNGTSFTTTVHAWPSPDFTFLPNAPSVGQDVLIRRDQDSDGDTFGTRCFDINNNSVSCGNYYWTIQDSSPVMSNTASSSIPVIVSFTSSGRKEIMLKATDADGFYCLKLRTTGTVTLPLPRWKEVLPR